MNQRDAFRSKNIDTGHKDALVSIGFNFTPTKRGEERNERLDEGRDLDRTDGQLVLHEDCPSWVLKYRKCKVFQEAGHLLFSERDKEDLIKW